MTKSQEKALNRIKKIVLEEVILDSEVEIIKDWEITPTDYGPIWLVVQTERTDCHKYSPRNAICSSRGHFCIGKGGKITPMDYSGTKKDAVRWPVRHGMNTCGADTTSWWASFMKK